MFLSLHKSESAFKWITFKEPKRVVCFYSKRTCEFCLERKYSKAVNATGLEILTTSELLKPPATRGPRPALAPAWRRAGQRRGRSVVVASGMKKSRRAGWHHATPSRVWGPPSKAWVSWWWWRRRRAMPVHWRWGSSHVHGRGRQRRRRWPQIHSHRSASSTPHVRIRPRSTHAPPHGSKSICKEITPSASDMTRRSEPFHHHSSTATSSHSPTSATNL